MVRKDLARKLFKEGYTCSQAVVLAFKDLLNVDEITLTKLSLPFGGGLGRLRLTCGAASGMAIVIGLLFSSEENNPENKKDVYQITQKLLNKFKEINGSLICKELLTNASLNVEVGKNPEARTNEYYKKRPCDEIVYVAARIIEEYLEEKNIL